MAPDDAADVDLLRSSAREFLADRGEKDSVEDLAQLDWTSLLVDEQYGGAGWLPVETVVIAEELGRAGDRSPWFGTTMAAAALTSAPAEIRDRWLPSLLDGTVRAGLALAGSTVRVTSADALRLVITLGSAGIHLFELSDTTSSSRDDELLDVDRPAWRVELAGTEGVPVGEIERADRLLAVGRVLLSADSLGALATTFERLVAYLKERIDRLRCPHRQLSGRATPTRRPAGPRDEGPRGDHESGPFAGVRRGDRRSHRTFRGGARVRDGERG